MVTVQSRTAPGARVPGSRVTAWSSGTSAEDLFPAAYSLSAPRLVSAVLDDLSWTVRPDTAVRVGLATVPCTVTGRPGLAICGLTEAMLIVTDWADAAAVRDAPARAVAAAAAPPPASAGPPATSTTNAHASTPRQASLGHAGLAGLWSRCVGH
jgi:hypothetical protein